MTPNTQPTELRSLVDQIEDIEHSLEDLCRSHDILAHDIFGQVNAANNSAAALESELAKALETIANHDHEVASITRSSLLQTCDHVECLQKIEKLARRIEATLEHNLTGYGQGAYLILGVLFKQLHDLATGAATTGSEWQPIETAPKDESVFIGFEAGGIDFYYRTDDTPDDAAISENLPIRCYPTHWIPLPDPPASGDTL